MIRNLTKHSPDSTFRTPAWRCLENRGRHTRQDGEQEAVVGGAEREAYVAERLDHLGIVAGVCREIGLAPTALAWYVVST